MTQLRIKHQNEDFLNYEEYDRGSFPSLYSVRTKLTGLNPEDYKRPMLSRLFTFLSTVQKRSWIYTDSDSFYQLIALKRKDGMWDLVSRHGTATFWGETSSYSLAQSGLTAREAARKIKEYDADKKKRDERAKITVPHTPWKAV